MSRYARSESDDETLSSYIPVRFSPREKANLMTRCEEEGRSASKVLRKLALAWLKTKKKPLIPVQIGSPVTTTAEIVNSQPAKSGEVT